VVHDHQHRLHEKLVTRARAGKRGARSKRWRQDRDSYGRHWILMSFSSGIARKAPQEEVEFEARMENKVTSRGNSLFMSISYLISRWISYALAVLALAAALGLLIGDVGIGNLPGLSKAATSAAPLLLVGTSFLFVQPILRPRLLELLKNLLLAATFLLWGIIQFLPQNAVSIRLGNAVIALYVLDLAWVTLGTVISQERN